MSEVEIETLVTRVKIKTDAVIFTSHGAGVRLALCMYMNI